jgi:hypothetical protein
LTVLAHFAGLGIAELDQPGLIERRVVGVALLQGVERLIVGVGQHAVGAELLEQAGIIFGRRDRFGRIEGRHQVVGRLGEHIAAEAMQIGDPGPAVVVLVTKALTPS